MGEKGQVGLPTGNPAAAGRTIARGAASQVAAAAGLANTTGTTEGAAGAGPSSLNNNLAPLGGNQSAGSGSGVSQSLQGVENPTGGGVSGLTGQTFQGNNPANSLGEGNSLAGQNIPTNNPLAGLGEEGAGSSLQGNNALAGATQGVSGAASTGQAPQGGEKGNAMSDSVAQSVANAVARTL
jgi:hypothetical protein